MKQFLIVIALAAIVASGWAQPPAPPPVIVPEPRNAPPPATTSQVVRALVKAFNNTTGKLDLATPENAVRLFVESFNDNDWKTARTCVAGALTLEQIAPLIDAFKPMGSPNLLVSDLSVYYEVKQGIDPVQRMARPGRGPVEDDAEEATVTLRMTDLGYLSPFTDLAALPQRFSASQERLTLRHGAAGWQIVPDKLKLKAFLDEVIAEQPEPARPADSLAMTATFMAVPGAYDNLTKNMALHDEKVRCQSNLKKLMLAVMQYTQDWDGNIPNADKWQEQLMPYVKTAEIFLCPEDKTPGAKSSYAFNSKVGKDPLQALPVPRDPPLPDPMVLIYDAKDGELAFRHKLETGEEAAYVAFTDGHVKLVGREEAKTLRWKP